MNTDCPFCTLPTERIWFQDAAVLPFHDGYPVNPGHTLVIPRRHVQSAFDLASDEPRAFVEAVRNVRQLLKNQSHPDGFNIASVITQNRPMINR